MADSPAPPSRFVAINIRQHAALVCAVDPAQQVALAPCEITLAELEPWLRQQIQPADAAVIVSLANAWQIYDSVSPRAAAVLIAHPQIANLIPNLHTSSDPRDTLKLARLHAAGLIPALWVPPLAVRDLRALTAYRRRLIMQHAEAGDRLRNIMRRRHLTPPGANRLGSDRPDWWAAQALTPGERACVRESLAALNRAINLLADVDGRLEYASLQAPWQARVDRAMRLAGMRRISAITLLAAIGEIERFPSANQLVGYSGLAGAQHAVHPAHEEALAVKEGRREIRATMLDVAERAIYVDAHWRTVFEGLEQRIGAQRAIVAVARKLLVVLWRTLAAPATDLDIAVTSDSSIRIAA